MLILRPLSDELYCALHPLAAGYLVLWVLSTHTACLNDILAPLSRNSTIQALSLEIHLHLLHSARNHMRREHISTSSGDKVSRGLGHPLSIRPEYLTPHSHTPFCAENSRSLSIPSRVTAVRSDMQKHSYPPDDIPFFHRPLFPSLVPLLPCPTPTSTRGLRTADARTCRRAWPSATRCASRAASRRRCTSLSSALSPCTCG